MATPSSPSRASDGRRAWIGPAAVGVMAVLAYRTPLLRAFDVSYDLDRWFYRPSALPPLAILGVAGWLLWQRRDRLRSLPAPGAPIPATVLAALGAGVFVWATLTSAADLYLASASLNLLAFAAASRGWSGCRVVLLPSVVLLLGIPIPAPIKDEIVWQLQVWTTTAAAWLLDIFGRELVRGGVILRSAEHSFHVIDGCSGMKGIQILTVTALIVRELFSGAGRREWLLVAAAPPIAFVLNVVRIAYVAASPNPEALAGPGGDHTAQGIAVLVTGTGILYALGYAMARGTIPQEGHAQASGSTPRDRAPWAAGAAGLGALTLLTLTLPRFEASAGGRHNPAIDFPLEKSGWVSEPIQIDRRFLGVIPGAVIRRYTIPATRQHPAVSVDVLIGFEHAELPSTSLLLSSKLALPGPEWDLLREERVPLWMLNRDTEMALASPGAAAERAVVYTWRLRDTGIWRESWRSLAALEQSPFRRKGRRAVVRLVAYAPHEGQLMLDQAKQRLDRFVVDFRDVLATL